MTPSEQLKEISTDLEKRKEEASVKRYEIGRLADDAFELSERAKRLGL